MKIIFVVDSLANSGTERSLLDILSHFSTNTKAILIYLQPPHLLKNDFDSVGIKTIWLNESKKQNFITNLFLANKIIRAEQPDFVVSSLYKSNLLARFSCLLTNTKLIGTFVSDSYSKMRFNNYTLKQKIGFFIIKQFDNLTAKIPVAFIATNHTTGGNSGSPALDAKGNLIGLNFDRVWEGTMSDIYYSPEICRNIMVDIRYVLFIIDKFAGADNLINELKIIAPKKKM